MEPSKQQINRAQIVLQQRACQILNALTPGLDPTALLIDLTAQSPEIEQISHLLGSIDPQTPIWRHLMTLHRLRGSLVQSSAPHQGRHAFVGRPEVVADRILAPLLTINAHTFDAAPKLVAYLVGALLDETSNHLAAIEAEHQPGELHLDRTTLLRQAGRRVCDAIDELVGVPGTFETLNLISAKRDEGRAGTGRFVFCRPEHKKVSLDIRFEQPIGLEDAGWAHKTLQIAEGDLIAVCHGPALIGLGRLTDLTAPDLLVVEFVDHFHWRLLDQGVVLMEVSYGVPDLPRPQLRNADFRLRVQTLFQGLSPQDENALWALVSQGIKQTHGTMIVISDAAAAETLRLAGQATRIQPTRLAPDVIDRVSSIDGALIVDRHAACHAIGVILDGHATEQGDPARGARYNSAIRYAASVQVPTLALVISEDGHVDMI